METLESIAEEISNKILSEKVRIKGNINSSDKYYINNMFKGKLLIIARKIEKYKPENLPMFLNFWEDIILELEKR